MERIVLYPCEYGNINKVDEDYKFEQMIAQKNGIITYLFNYDAFTSMGEKLKLNFGRIDKTNQIQAIYRGWMMKPEKYKEFYEELLIKHNIKLVNNPEEYENAHLFNKAFDKLMDYTPKIAIYYGNEEIDWDEVKDYFDKFMIKDFVKSVKEWDFPEYFDYTHTNTQMEQYVKRFKELRGDLLTGGIILKEYVELDKTGGNTHEFRGFFYRGRLITLYHNSDNHSDSLDKVIKFANKLPKLESNFYTIDFAITKDNKIIVIECGDGQVSGLPSEKEADLLYESLEKYKG